MPSSLRLQKTSTTCSSEHLFGCLTDVMCAKVPLAYYHQSAAKCHLDRPIRPISCRFVRATLDIWSSRLYFISQALDHYHSPVSMVNVSGRLISIIFSYPGHVSALKNRSFPTIDNQSRQINSYSNKTEMTDSHSSLIN